MPQIMPAEILDPAASKAAYQALVLTWTIGLPLKLKTCVACFPRRLRISDTASALSGTATRLGLIGMRQASCDGIEGLVAKVRIEPSEMHLVRLDRRLVRLLLQPPHDRVVPSAAWLLPKLGDPPQLVLEPVVKLLC